MDIRTDAEFKLYTRFKKAEFVQLAHELQLPAIVKTAKGDTAGRLEALWIFLVRMANPGTNHVLNQLLNLRDRRACGRIFYAVLEYVYDNFAWTVQDINRWRLHMPSFAAACAARRSAYVTLMSMIDGTLSAMCRPRGGYSPAMPDGIQRSVFSGHKKRHGLKYQGVVIPNGLFGDFFGPVLGRRSDSFLLAVSGFLNRMRRLQQSTGVRYIAYGDAAYAPSPYIQRAFKGANLTQQQRALNRRMRPLRIAVEWIFGSIEQQWGYLRYPKGMQMLKQPLGTIFTVAAVLTNCHTCCYGNVTVNYFNCAPPSLHDYLHTWLVPL
jgi:hypothetical protein